MGLTDNRIPPEKLPPCWSDDVRMNALFAPFRLKTANPESWEMKMKFWSEMLRVWCRHRSDPIVSAADAKVAFQREGRTAACLDIVVEELYRNGSLAPINKYQQILHNGPEGWIGWGARLAFRPAVFALTAVSSLLPGKQAVDGDGLPKASVDAAQRFVLESAVEEQATDLLNNFPAECPRLGTVDELMLSSGRRGRETFELLLGWLVSRGHAVKKGEVVKLAASTSTRAAPVSESDEALVRLLSAERRLERDATRLSRDVEQATSDARASLQLGNKLAAKNHLRRKHKLSERATKCESALDNVRHLVLSMQEMDVNKEVVDSYKMTSQAMKRGMKESGIDEDTVHDTMDDLKEVLDTYSEVEKALSSTVDDFDAAELEDELKELLATPPPAGGGTPDRGERRPAPVKLPSPPARLPEDFVYDGEARVLAELSELSAGDSPRQSGTHKPSVNRTRTAVADVWQEEKESERPSQPWYPKNSEFGASRADDMSQEFAELHMDDRLHPGQKLDVDHRSPTKHCVSDFEVNDHRLQDGVWLFNSRQNEAGDLRTNIGGTDYNSADSPGRALFQMAPGGERRGSASPWQPDQTDRPDQPDRPDQTDQLQRRLDQLRKL